MRIIFSIGKEFFNVDVKIPVPLSLKPTAYEHGASHSFQPQTFPVMKYELDGLYRLTVEKVSDYFEFFTQLWSIEGIERESEDFITLALLFDLLSYTAFILHKHCDIEWTSDELHEGRITMQMEVNIINGQRDFEEGWAQTLCGIIANCMPFISIIDVKPWECGLNRGEQIRDDL